MELSVLTELINSVGFPIAMVGVFGWYINKRDNQRIEIEKETKANSMPSRHVFSACLIAMVCLEINTTFGCVLLFLALISAVLRVIGGVHFVSDVVVGYITGIICGILLFL